MKKTMLLAASMALIGAISARAQLANGDFTTGDTTGWTQVAGSNNAATVYTPGSTFMIGSNSGTTPTSTSGNVLFLQSTAGDGTYDSGSLTETADGSVSSTAAHINSALGVTLPNSNAGEGEFGYVDLAEYANGNDNPPAVNGQAVYQTFTLNGTSTLSFNWSMSTNDIGGFDGVGYSLNDLSTGVANYTQLDAPYYENSTPAPTSPQNTSIVLAAGTYTLGFAAYNTFDNGSSTGMFVSDVNIVPEAAPEPRSWLMGILACLGAAGAFFVNRRSALV